MSIAAPTRGTSRGALTASAGWDSRGRAGAVRRQRPPRKTRRKQTHPGEGRRSTAACSALTVGDKLLQWAFMPALLEHVELFRGASFAARSGWRLTRERDPRDASTPAARPAQEFTVMFLPFKSQVYWPLARTPAHAG